MLQYKLETLEGLEEQFHSLYEQKDGAYFLKVSGVVPEDDLNGLKASRDALLAEKKEQQRKAEEAEAERLRVEREAQEELARKNGDWKALELSYQEKLQAREAELLAQQEALTKQVYGLTVGQQATKIAGELFKPHAQALVTQFIESRLTLDNGVVRVLDAQGKPSAMTFDELKNELKTNPMFQDIVIVNTNSGGGAAGSGFGGGAAKKPNEYTVQEMKELRASNPELYNQLFPLK